MTGIDQTTAAGSTGDGANVQFVVASQAESYMARAGQIPEGTLPFAERDLDLLRRETRALALEFAGPSETVKEVQDMVIGSVPVRLYRPGGNPEGALVWIHGGAWILGDLDSYDALCRALANRASCVVISVDYRLAPEHHFPAAIDDAWQATAWAVDEFEKVAVAGDSAGGNLAAAVALRARDRGITLAHQLLVYPALQFPDTSDLYDEFIDRYRTFGPGDFGLDSREALRQVWSIYIPNEQERELPDAAPLRVDSLAGVASASIVLAEHDIIRVEGLAYAQRLEKAGVAVEVADYPGQIHGFFGLLGGVDDARAAVDWSAQKIRAALKVGQA